MPIDHRLQDELTLLRALVDAVPDPIFCKDLQGRYVFTNRADAVRWDTEEGGLIGRTVFEVPGLREHAELYHTDDLKVMETGEPMINHEEPFVDRHGNPGWYLTSKFPLRNAAGEIIGLVGIARDITERKQVERRLADERQLLQTVLDAIPDPVFFKDLEGRHVLFNRANEEMFDLRDDNYLGKTPLERDIPREFAEAYMRDDRQVLETGQAVVNRDEPYQDRHGKRGWFLTSKYPLSDASGQPIGLVGISRDITERKEADRIIQEERSFLKALMDAIPDIIFFKDREGRHLHINAADRKVFGVEEGVHLGKTVFEWPIPPEIAAQYAADDRHVIETGESIVNREEPFVRADGTSGWFLTSKLPIHNAEGEVTGIVGIARDITQLKIDREELERTRSRLIDHVENSPLAVIEWRDGFYFDRWAGQAEAMFGWTAGEVLGKSVHDLSFIHPDELEAATARARRLVDGLENRNISNHRNLTKDGRTIHCVWHNSVLRDAQGRMVSVLSLVQDVTEQVHAHETARRAEAERSDLERQLLETQKLESLGVLAGGIAHDFNNLLTGVLGNATLASNELPPNSPLQTYLEQIEAAAMRAAELCKQMLAYSGRGRFVVRQLSLNALVEETTGLLRSSIHHATQLTLDLEPHLPAVLADETQMRQIVMNLVINASEALGEKPGTIRVRTGRLEVDRKWLSKAHAASDLPPGEYLLLEVSDTGAGMPPEVMARIFEPFFSTKFTGRGLGLAAVLGIVRGHHGAIRLTSNVGRGTKFEILLPISDASTEPGTPATPSSTWRGSGRVLVIDDEKMVRATSSRMLEMLGFEPVTANGGESGLKKFRADPDGYRAILLDLTMPTFDGEWTFCEIRKLKPDAQVILMSGFNPQEVAARFSEASPVAFIEKPFKLADLRTALQSALE